MKNIRCFDNHFYIPNRHEYQQVGLTGPYLDYLGPYATEAAATEALTFWENLLTEAQNGNRS